MCGIAGAVRKAPGRRTSEAQPGSARLVEWVDRISAAQGHRGPDAAGRWESSGHEVVFGHRRLAIIDLTEGGAQPMRDPESGCAVTFNGEIYNFLDLRRELADLGDVFRSASDTEVILKAYGRWGIDAVRRFRGIFAFGLWDPRAGVVHLVRDPMGIKPLYWTITEAGEHGQTLLFASELRALLASGAVGRRLDPAAVAGYLWNGFVVGPGTIVEGVHLLPAASILTVAANSGTEPLEPAAARPYWTMPHEGSAKTTVELHEALGSTVAMQLVSDVPLGVFLSGGVDSSAVAAVAAAAAPGSLHTFTIGFEEAAYDESRHARAVADAIGSRHTSVMLTEQSFQDQLPSALAAIDQPTFDGINTYFVSRAARDAGMTVALAGTGGDEIFGGYPSFVDIPRGLRAGTCLPAADGSSVTGRILDRAVGLADRVVHAWHWKVRGVASPQTRWAKWADAARAAHDEVGLYQVFYALFTGATQARLAGTQVAAAQRALDHGLSTGVARLWRERVAGAEPLHAVSLLELSSFVGERLLRDTDAASMAVSLEVRVPLLDHVLVETVAGVDPARRFMPPRAKQLLRDTGLRKLDPALFDRPKSGFVLPIDTWARRRLQPQMAAVFADAELARRVGLNAGVLGTLWRSFLEGRRGLYWSRVWALYVLLCWCRDQDVRLDG